MWLVQVKVLYGNIGCVYLFLFFNCMKLHQEDNILEFTNNSQILQSKQSVAKTFLRSPSGNIPSQPTPPKIKGTSIGKYWEEKAPQTSRDNPMKYSQLLPLTNSVKELPQFNGNYLPPSQNYKFFRRVDLKEKQDQQKNIQKESVILNFSKTPRTHRPEKSEMDGLEFSQSRTNRPQKPNEQSNQQRSTQNSESFNTSSNRTTLLSQNGLAASAILKFRPPSKTNLSQLIDKDTYEIDASFTEIKGSKYIKRRSFCLEEMEKDPRIAINDESLPTNAVTREIGGGAFSNSYPTNNAFLKFKTAEKSSIDKSKIFSNEVIGNPIMFNLDRERQVHSDKAINKQKRKPLCKGDFEIGRRLGKGKYGDVYLTRHRQLGFACAMKIIEKDLVRRENVEHQIIREMKIAQYVTHTNLTNLYGYFNDEQNVYLLLQLCSEGNLFQVLKERKRLPESLTITAISQLCQGIEYLHRQNVIHRDIKPQNIIIENGVLKLCDFGWAVFCEDKFRSTFCGTPLYVSPEVLKGDEYNQKIDIWAIGILTYELLIGRVPFRINSEADMAKIIHQQIVFPQYVAVSDLAKSFILTILNREPSNRVDIQEVINHPFLQQQAPNLFLFQ